MGKLFSNMAGKSKSKPPRSEASIAKAEQYASKGGLVGRLAQQSLDEKGEYFNTKDWRARRRRKGARRGS